MSRGMERLVWRVVATFTASARRRVCGFAGEYPKSERLAREEL
jgi:hypothetical protein